MRRAPHPRKPDSIRSRPWDIDEKGHNGREELVYRLSVDTKNRLGGKGAFECFQVFRDHRVSVLSGHGNAFF